MGVHYMIRLDERKSEECGILKDSTCDYCSVMDEVKECVWIKSDDKVKKLVSNVYKIKKSTGKTFNINRIGNIFITAAHCLDEEFASHCVNDHDIAIYDTITGKKGDEIWHMFRNQLLKGTFMKQIYKKNVNSFKPGDSGLLCVIADQINMQHCKALQTLDHRGILLVSGGTQEKICNGLLSKQEEYGSAGSVVGNKWESRSSMEKVFSGDEGDVREMFGVEWIEFNNYCKIVNRVLYPYHILDSEEKKYADKLHQFPDLATDTIHDLKGIERVKIPGGKNEKFYEFDLKWKIFSWHETHDRVIFAILPAFETRNESTIFKSGTPIFNAQTNEIVSCITKNYKGKIYAVSGIGWESGQIEKDTKWIGVSYHYVGKGESVYGNFYGPYGEVKTLAAAKALEAFGEKTGLGIYSQEKIVQVVTYDENGKERWRVRLFRENCPIADKTE